MVTVVSVLFGCIAFFLAVGVPIGISIGAATAISLLANTSMPLTFLAQNAFTALDSFPMLAVPLFILSGSLMGYGGISKRLVAFANALVGFISGGLAMVTVLACMFFSAISGSSVATASAIGGFMIPEMKNNKYDGDFAAALTAAGACLGVIIPPSISFVIYGVMTGASIGELFTAGIIPGIILGLGLMVVGYFICRKRDYQPKSEKGVSLKDIFVTGKDAFWAIMVPIIILGGIYGGIFTPTEAAGVSVIYSIVIGVFVYKELTFKLMYQSMQESALVTGAVTFMMGLSMSFAKYLTVAGVPTYLSTSMLNLTSNAVIILILINVFLLIVGCFIDNISAAIILVPIMLPIIQSLGVDVVHFGVITTIALSIGFITPPYGPTLFVASACSGEKIEAISRQVMPFFLVLVALLFVITFMPSLSLGLVHFIYD